LGPLDRGLRGGVPPALAIRRLNYLRWCNSAVAATYGALSITSPVARKLLGAPFNLVLVRRQAASLNLFSPKLYIISLAWLDFHIALLKGLICNWLEKARICLNAC